ncbi:cytochrome c [Legionella spiritensis]|uniref:c-type cytochrome n=1 Tax=Legionella spiritensis TaxID=452 RepID=UPI000F6C9432|nr:cytochrome c [Legionella spiritensis]VEG92103.1 Cytochrome c, mono- and diheme variants [Legionella spiritensis]
MKIISMPKLGRILVLSLTLCCLPYAKANKLNPEPANLSLPQRGYWLLLNKPFAPPLLNEEDYNTLWTVWPEPLRSLARKASQSERRAMALKRYGFQESPDRLKGDIPQQFTRDSKNNLSINCLACHGGKVAGTVILGLGNSHINFATFNEDLALLFVKSNKKIKPAPKILPPEAPDPVRGVNNAWAGAVLYMLVRNNDLQLTPEKLQFPKPSHQALNIPMDTPAFWNVHHKKNLYYDGFVQKSHRDIMQFVFDFSVPAETIYHWDNDFKSILAWIDSLRSPKYPWKIDMELAKKGQKIFRSQCAFCHGKYGDKRYYPERLINLEDLGTDPARTLLSIDFKKHLVSTWIGYYGKTPLNLTKNAYVAMPLDGIWATAPYLHNGSVPTLWHLLNPDKRPSVWLRMEDGYDQNRVGLEIKEFSHLPDTIKSAQEKRLYYQTNIYGLSNQGHRFPKEGLSKEDTDALLEYLKTL